ncbi:MepB family protein [Chryseobacterium tongliaoense]|uniref:MepB family protein n=1 Tax=Chryseobacterium tongliaoense TaxID=3240933 RepID=UPI0035159CAE
MVEIINRIENSVFKALQLELSNLTADPESEEYSGHNFLLNTFIIKFRKAKITPTKNGQFVTLWRRNSAGKTEPFTSSDHFDFYIIATEQNNSSGFFIFPKKVLAEKQILTSSQKEGKRGFRVYPPWDKAESKQAERTQNWQIQFFIDISDSTIINFDTLKNILVQH